MNIPNLSETAVLNDALFSALSGLIAIPSVKGPPSQNAPYGVFTAKALQYMLALGKQQGFTVKNLDNRAGYIEWGCGKQMIAVLCHLDVVPPGEGWNTNPYILTRNHSRLYGRGIVDNKGPAICTFFSMLLLKRKGYVPPCRIRLIIGLDEEHGCSCMDHYVATEELPTLGFTPDADFPAIFAEKGILQISFSGKASDRYRAVAGEAINMVPSICTLHDFISDTSVVNRGVSAHASTPDQGVNAIMEAISALPDDLSQNEPLFAFMCKYFSDKSPADLLVTSISEDISGALTVNPAILLMDDFVSSVTFDIRYPVLGNFDHLLQELTVKSSEFGLIPTIESHLKPLHLPTDSPLITTLLSVYEEYLDSFYCADKESEMYIRAIDRPIKPMAIGGGTYARSMPGIVAFGPSLPWEPCQMHQTDESVHEDTLLKLVPLYAEAISRLCDIVK